MELAEEELEFMTYLKIAEVYQEWVQERRAEGIQEGITKMVLARFGINDSTAQISTRLEKLNEQQINEFTAIFFEWQNPSEALAWLMNILGE